MKIKKIKVVEKSLKRQKVDGLAYLDRNLIEIEKDLNNKDKFSTLLHECLHHAFPDLVEDSILRGEVILIDVLWNQGYRKVNN